MAQTQKTKDCLNFDKRSVDYSTRVHLHPQTYVGDVETAYTVGCNEQHEIDRAIYTPTINYLMKVVDSLSKMAKDMPLISDFEVDCGQTVVYLLLTNAQDMLDKIPYQMRHLGGGIYLQTEKEKNQK